MNIKERIETLRSLRKELSEKKALLSRARKLREEAKILNLSQLLESDLEQAKLILAAKDVCDRLQKIAEHLAELGAEAIMPLSDAMKGAFGPEAAATFEHAANTNIQTALETVRAAKDSINDAILQVEGKMPPQNDMNNPGATPPNDMAVSVDNTAGTPATDTQNDDEFAGADAASGPNNEPLGRARKESKNDSRSVIEGKSFKYADDDDDIEDPKKARKKAKDQRDEKQTKRDSKIEESLMLSEVGCKILEHVSLDKLVSWLLSEAAKSMPHDKFIKFSQSVSSKAINTPEAMAGWIGKKRWGDATLRKLVESKEDTRAESIAKGIATVIETNISLFGKGKAAQVVESYTTDLHEGEGSSVLEAFSQIYGCDPALYSLRLAKQMREDTPATTSSGDSTLDQEDKQNVSSAIDQIAAKMAKDPSVASQPTANVISGLDANSQSALQKIAGDTSTGNIQNVGQLVQAANDKIKTSGIGESRRSEVPATKRANKGENVEDDKKGVGKAKKLKGTNAKKTIAKEDLIKLGESKIHHRSKHHHPSYLMGVGGYYAGLPRAAFVGGYAGCDPDHGCKGFDDACGHDSDDSGSAPATTAVAASAPAAVGESTKSVIAKTYEDQISKASKQESDEQRVKNSKKDHEKKTVKNPLPIAQPKSKKYKAKDKEKVVEWSDFDSIFNEDDDAAAKMHDAVLNIITPLESQGITSITFQQIKQQLENDPDFEGLEITDDLISQGLDGIDGVNAAPDNANNGEMTVTFSSTSDAPEALAQTTNNMKTVDQAATRQATKDLGV